MSGDGRPPGERALRLRRVVAVAAALGGLAPAALAAQESTASARQMCVAAGGDPAVCLEAALAARAVQAQIGLMAGLGSEVAGSAGTLGRRLGTTPRVAVSIRGGFAAGGAPDLADPGPAPSREAGYVVPAVHAGVAVGVFDGFRVLPTVGGVLSVDLLLSTSLSFPPSGDGFDGRVGAVSMGARLGVLRESFTLPGVAVSVTRRALGDLRFGAVEAGSDAEFELDPSVTSLRATVGKDLLSVGVMAGVGRDWYGGRATFRTPATPAVVVDGFEHDRMLYFGGASLSFLVLQLSAEVGWATGQDAVPGYVGNAFDPGSGTVFGSLAFRLTI